MQIAAYARVSTEKESQVESFEKQILCSYQTMEKENNIDNQKRGQIMISLEELKKGKDLKYT